MKLKKSIDRNGSFDSENRNYPWRILDPDKREPAIHAWLPERNLITTKRNHL
jgi:hypothetical protein